MVKMSVEMDDEALRKELASFGEAVSKITAKTRPLCVKKLNHLRARQTMSEKSDIVDKRKSTGRRSRGSALTAPQEPVTKYRLDFEDDSDAEMNGLEEKTRSDQKTRRRTVQGSNVSEMSNEVSPARSGRRSMSGAVFKSSHFGDVDNDAGLPKQMPPRPSAARAPPRVNASGLNQLRTDAGKADKAASSLIDFSDSEQTEEEVKDTASVGINTSAWMDNSSGSFFGNKSLSESSLMGKMNERLSWTPGRSYQQGSVQRGSYSDQWKGQGPGSEVHNSSKWQFVSRLLVICALVFFLVLVSLYLSVRLGVIPPMHLASDRKLLLCTENDVPDCLTSKQQDILVNLVDILASRAGDYDCGNVNVNRSMMKMEALGLLQSLMEISEDELDYVLDKISNLPNLKIRLMDVDYEVVASSDDVVHLESTEAKMSYLCRLRKSFVQVTVTLLTVIASTVALVCFSLLVRRKLTRLKEEKKEVHQLAGDIVSLLQNHAVACQSDPKLVPYLAIAHVRDALIPVSQRKQKIHLWNQAVDLVSTSESRVREELQLVDDDKQESVWRYLDVPTDPLKQSDDKQMTLSDLDVKAVSACLKISNILDGSEDRKEIVDGSIRDAVLERCGSYHGILHIDSYENCVYIKLVSESAAGQAFKYLHGWYYKGKLVSVRYVSPLLYRTLFPESVNAMVPLRSSAHRRRSTYLSGSVPVKTSF